MSPLWIRFELDRLSTDEKILLAQELWDSIESDNQVSLTDAQRQDLKRRLADYEVNPTAGSTWEEVKNRFRSQAE